MNKKLIKEYKTEFEHFLNEGKLLAMLDNKDERWFDITEKTSIFSHDYPFAVKHIIINDKYVEFRKHGAEGKQLQVSYDNGKIWYDKQYHKISWNDKQKVRIKPEYTKEPENVFLLNDFVVTPNGSVARVLKSDKDGSLYASNHYELVDCKKWYPSHKELCWFSDCIEPRTFGDDFGVLTHFDKMNKSHFQTIFGRDFKYCEPFLNSKPSWFK